MRQQIVRLLACLVLPLATAATVMAAASVSKSASSAGNDALFARLDGNHDGQLTATEIGDGQRPLFDRLVRRADVNRDKSLSREEFITGLVPTRPEKVLEAKQPDGYPQAKAIRYLLLTMDADKDASIRTDEVPAKMASLFESLVAEMDTNKNGILDRYELSRDPRVLNRASAQYVSRQRIDVDQELAKLEKAQGDLARRFDEPPGAFLSNLSDPKKAHNLFIQFDADKNGQLVISEFPEPLQKQMQRFVKMADRDRSGGLSEQEFTVAAMRLSRLIANQGKPNAANNKRPRLRAQSPADKATVKQKPIDLRSVEAKSGDEMTDESMPDDAMPADEKN
jgi:hypothetical protein